MKWKRLSEIVREYAHDRKMSAAYSGSYTDGGHSSILSELDRFKQILVVKYDLRPSEYKQLEEIEVGEPPFFFDIIESHKKKLARELVKKMKL